MPDRWGRPTINDGMSLMRGAMAVQGFQQRQKVFDEQELADKYFGMKLEGEGVPQGEGYNPKAELMADELVNRKWKVGQVKNLATAEKKLSDMPDEEVLNFKPSTYAEHLVAASRVKMIGSNEANRQAIDQLNQKKALEAYQYSTAAFSEARDKYARGDTKGASEELVKIGQITNNPFKVKPSEDGKTVELYFTKDGEDQPGEKIPIDQAMQIAQEHLNGEEFFKAHLQNREARKSLNEKALLNPVIFEKGGKKLHAVRELDLNTNQVRWSVYGDDKKGGLHNGQPISDINQLYKDGWKRYDSKTVDETLKRTKLVGEIEKIGAQTEKARAETKKAEGGETPAKWRKDWWPGGNAMEGEDPIVAAARSVITKTYDTSTNKETKRLISGQVFPEFKKWVDENKGQMVMDTETGEEREMTSEDVQNAFDHIAYDIAQKSQAKAKPVAEGKGTERKPVSGEAKKPAEKKQGVTSAGTMDGIEVGIDSNGQPVIKDGKVWRAPKTSKEKQAVAKLADWRSKVKTESTEWNPRKPMTYH